MAVEYGRSMENGREETYGEITGFQIAGDTMIFRITLLNPYRHYDFDVWPPVRLEPRDELLVHLDFWNVTDGTSGRYASIWLPEKEPGDNNLRRYSGFRKLQDLFQSVTPIPSPVYPL